ncbi:hypothetical protein BG011_009637 [Mortierella polycephala]|uniref:Chromosome transmission fidelity protein 8 n=1 Tax=Mortierella polycephala TaxID=41804 RepID=A0A9P6TVZ8_9FUNG|nr:hypothetical protein BG011_009637 [Mortierella polycephala]
MVLISIPTGISGGPPTTTLATCVDTKSTILLEFQGMIEMDGQTWAGNRLGQLSILDGGVKAQLVIGNHRLDGKVIKLDKPLLLIQKQQKPNVHSAEQQNIGHTGPVLDNDKSKSRDYVTHPDYDHHSSLTVKPPASPLGHDEDDTMTSMASIQDQGRENEAVDPMAPSNIQQTVQYDTVAIIRQKILFSAMPVPIIHTERRGLTVIKRGV